MDKYKILLFYITIYQAKSEMLERGPMSFLKGDGCGIKKKILSISKSSSKWRYDTQKCECVVFADKHLAREYEDTVCKNAPVDGAWSTWDEWNACSVSCEKGSQVRYRHCTAPAPAYGGSGCTGVRTQSQTCDSGPCPIDGKWGEWSEYGSCNQTCGGGSMTRTRACDSPPLQYGGLECQGEDSQSLPCNTEECPGIGCIQENTQLLSDNVIQNRVMANFLSLEECRIYCQAHINCAAFVYHPPGKSCTIKRAFADFQQGPNGLIAGHKVCYDCHQHKVRITGNHYLEEVTVASEKACQRRCQAHSECTHYNFWKNWNSCRMTTGNSFTAIVTDDMYSGPKICKGYCFEIDKYYSGDVTKTVSTEIAEDCQRECQNTDNCVVFSYDALSSTCELKSKHTSRSNKLGTISGWKACSSCIDYGVEMGPGNDITSGPAVVPASNDQDCRAKCQEHADCQFFTRVGQCHLKTSDIGRRVAPTQNYRSGSKLCAAKHEIIECYESQISYDGENSIRDMSTESFEECRTLCQYKSDCFFFSFIIAATKICSLNPTERSRASVNVSLQIVYSGPKFCRKQCFQHGYSINQTAIKTSTVDFLSICQSSCQKDNNCRSFVHIASLNQCQFFDVEFKDAPMTDMGGAVAGPKYCIPNSCLEEGMHIIGSSIGPQYGGVIRLEDCHDRCRRTDGCNYYKYSRVSKNCYLKTQRLDEEVEPHANFVIGRVNCE